MNACIKRLDVAPFKLCAININCIVQLTMQTLSTHEQYLPKFDAHAHTKFTLLISVSFPIKRLLSLLTS